MTSEGGNWNLLPLYLDSVVYPGWHPRFGEVGPVYAFLLESDEYLVLVDTGIGPPHPLIDRLYQPTRRDLPTALAQNNGIALDDISAVILTHLHFDHAGGAQHFHGTPLYVRRQEWEAAQAPNYTIPEFLDFPGANFVLLDGEVELAPGLRLVPTAGHTPGHQAVVLETAAGRMVIAGQAVETRSEFDGFVATGELRDWAGDGSQTERLPAARRILEFEPAKVWFSHDHESWQPNPQSEINKPH